MRKAIVMVLTGLFLAVGSFSVAEEHGTAAQARLLVEKAAEFVKAHGKEKALAEFNNPKGQFVKGDLYIGAWDLNGKILSHPMNPKMVGVNGLNVPDAEGKLFRKEGIELVKAKGSGWIDYKYKNPVTNQIEQKTSYVKKVDDMVLLCGAYK